LKQYINKCKINKSNMDGVPVLLISKGIRSETTNFSASLASEERALKLSHCTE
jgi:hypothetical protein